MFKNFIFFLFLPMVFFVGCSTSKTNMESSQLTPVLDTSENSQMNHTSQAATLYSQAYSKTEEGLFSDASKLWKEFIDHYPGVFRYEQAVYHYAYCLFILGEKEQALQILKSTTPLPIKAKILMAEIWLKKDRYDEALAITFELLPNTENERKSGLKRYDSKANLSLSERIEIYTLRGRIFASIGYQEKAKQALLKAQKLIKHADFKALSQSEQRRLKAAWAWRQLEVLYLQCKFTNPIPERLSENLFLAYVDGYRKCTANAPRLYCQVHVAKDEQIRSQALETYRAIVIEPGKAEANITAPAREFKNDSQQKFFEKEMKELISQTVQRDLEKYRDIKECDAYGVF